MKKYLIAAFLTAFTAGSLNAQEIVNLYTGTIPGSKPAPADYQETPAPGKASNAGVTRVSVPQLFVYLPAKDKATGTAVIVCPGGGYGGLAIGHEGHDVAKQFNEIGVTAFVLKYRLPNDAIMTDKSFGPMMDVQQAMYLVRKNAAQWNVNPAKVGIMGFSAGGHLASTLTVHYKDVKIENKEGLSLRPDFSILIYPVITFGDFTHAGSVKNLLGPNGTTAQKAYFSSDQQVDAETPPTFLVHANDDMAVPVQNSIFFNLALVKHKVNGEMHIYQSGGHGFGLKNKTTNDAWFDRLNNWMKANKFL